MATDNCQPSVTQCTSDQSQEFSTRLDAFALPDIDSLDEARMGSAKLILHLHGLDHEQSRAAGALLIFRNQEFPNSPRYGSHDFLWAVRTAPRRAITL